MCNLVHESLISSSEKQQTTLKSFLKPKPSSVISPSKSKEEMMCLANSKEFEPSFNSLDDHVNSCATNSNVSDNETEALAEDSMQTIDESENKLCFDVSKNANPDSETIIYFCPVCKFSPSVKSMIELNKHIDECLNKATIKEMLSNDLQVTVKRFIF